MAVARAVLSVVIGFPDFGFKNIYSSSDSWIKRTRMDCERTVSGTTRFAYLTYSFQGCYDDMASFRLRS